MARMVHIRGLPPFRKGASAAGFAQQIVRFEHPARRSHINIYCLKSNQQKCFKVYVPDCRVCSRPKQIITF
jgi:hypothetical protein